MEKQCGRLSFGKMISAFEIMKDVSENLHKNRKFQHCCCKEYNIMEIRRRTIARVSTLIRGDNWKCFMCPAGGLYKQMAILCGF